MSARSPARGVMPGQGCPVSDVREKLRQVGLRPTRQRISLAWILFGKGNRHVTAEMLYEEALHARVPVSLATIYNTLHQLTEAGLLRPLMVDGNKAYFDTNPSEHHHFFVEDDQMLIDLPKETVQSLIPVAPEGYEVIDVELLVRLRRREAS
ncbi:MAG: transcriptional repressor [Methylobacteriaceae bacterium]|nr:transcriptional repressor [Methylobacteriaceae bacterium]